MPGEKGFEVKIGKYIITPTAIWRHDELVATGEEAYRWFWLVPKKPVKEVIEEYEKLLDDYFANEL